MLECAAHGPNDAAGGALTRLHDLRWHCNGMELLYGPTELWRSCLRPAALGATLSFHNPQHARGPDGRLPHSRVSLRLPCTWWPPGRSAGLLRPPSRACRSCRRLATGSSSTHSSPASTSPVLRGHTGRAGTRMGPGLRHPEALSASWLAAGLCRAILRLGPARASGRRGSRCCPCLKPPCV